MRFFLFVYTYTHVLFYTMPTMPRRWHVTTLNDQFGNFGGLVNEYSFQLKLNTVFTCGALAIHPHVRGPKTGGTWGHVFLFPDKTTRDHVLARYVQRHRQMSMRFFLLRNPLKSRTLAGGARQLYVLSASRPTTTTPKRIRRQEATRARSPSRKAMWAESVQRLGTQKPST